MLICTHRVSVLAHNDYSHIIIWFQGFQALGVLRPLEPIIIINYCICYAYIRSLAIIYSLYSIMNIYLINLLVLLINSIYII